MYEYGWNIRVDEDDDNVLMFIYYIMALKWQ